MSTTPPQQHPACSQLGQYTLERGEDEASTIVNETVAGQLEHEEASRWHLVLQVLF